jgi:membrane protease YdiL (CAAX protease family)
VSVDALLRDGAGALHAPLRLVLFLLLAGACILIAQATAFPLLVRLADAPMSAQLGVGTLVLSLALLAAHALAFRLGRWGSWTNVGLGRAGAAPRLLGLATLLGCLAVGLPSLMILAVGWYGIVPGGDGSPVVSALSLAAVLLPAALWEELLARGYLFATIRDRWGAPAALVLTSVGFGLLHLGNPGANLQAVLQVSLAGFWLGGVLLATGSLYAAWLAHAAWNWTIAAVLHAPVSGAPFGTPGWKLVDAGPDWATGGEWGPEGGLLVLIGMSLTMIYLYRRRSGRMES